MYLSAMLMQCLPLMGFLSCRPGKWWQHFHLTDSIFTFPNNIIYLLIIDKNGRQAGNLTVSFQSPGVIGRLLSSNPADV